MQGNVFVSEPLISKITGQLSIMVAAPLYSEGNNGKSIDGVVYFVPHETFLNDIVSAIQIGENSRAYMINKSGDTIADITLDTITVQNIEEESQNDPGLQELAAIHAQMRQGENGFGSYIIGEDKMFAAYAPVQGTDGWSIAVTVPQNNYLESTKDAMVINIGVIVISILLSIIVALTLATNIGKPMKACVKRMKLLVEGDLDTPMPRITSKDETGVLVRSTENLVEGLRTVINDISYLLNEMANQNLDVHTKHEDVYVGSFQDILLSMRNMRIELSDAMRQVNHSAGGVASASEQLSVSSQTLSQGTTEQASAVQELASQISVISEDVKNTADVLHDVVTSIQSVVEAIDHIAIVSNEQSESVEQVSEGINQIATVVQNNSATAEEGAAASEQLSAEAACMKELVGRFTLASK